jgi:hypothetical protein
MLFIHKVMIWLLPQLGLLERRKKFNLMRNNGKLLLFERFASDNKNGMILTT